MQLARDASVVGQPLFTSRKPAETARTKLVRLAVPLGLVTVTVTGLLASPTPVSGKATRMGNVCTEPGTPPVPLSGTLADETSAGDAMVSVPLNAPLTLGEKTTPTEQLDPAPSPAPQVFCVRLKGEVAVSVSELAAEPPVSVTVTVCAGLDWPGARQRHRRRRHSCG